MYLKCSVRKKDGKEHRTWSIVESRRVRGKGCVQRHVLYLGEINDSQRGAWQKTIEVFEEEKSAFKQMAIFPEDRYPTQNQEEVIQVRLKEMTLHRPRQWGGCWLNCGLWNQLGLDQFWESRLPASREGTRWDKVLQGLVGYRLLDPGSEWRLHRYWYEQSSMSDLLGEDFSLVEIATLYRCLDKLLEHKEDLFMFLRQKWQDLFGAQFDVLLYDLTSTYFESDPPEHESKRKFGYSRDKRPDCIQVIIALIVTPEGFPVAYEVMDGNTQDRTTLPRFLRRIQERYGKVHRTWLMDRGVPTEEVLGQMRESVPAVSYLVGTPRGHLTALEKSFLDLPWTKVRESVEVKLLPQGKELYILARSLGRVNKERSIRRRRFKKFWKRLKELQKQKLSRDQLLEKLGAAKALSGSHHKLAEITISESTQAAFRFRLRKDKLRAIRRREGHYLLRTNLTHQDPGQLWQQYVTLTQIEESFKTLKGDLAIRPIFHQKDDRIEAHIFVAFLAYCLHVTLRQQLRPLAGGLTPRSVLEKFSTIQMIDVHLPTTDGRKLILSRYTQPDTDTLLLLHQLKLKLPGQPPPKISQRGEMISPKT